MIKYRKEQISSPKFQEVEAEIVCDFCNKTIIKEEDRKTTQSKTFYYNVQKMFSRLVPRFNKYRKGIVFFEIITYFDPYSNIHICEHCVEFIKNKMKTTELVK